MAPRPARSGGCHVEATPSSGEAPVPVGSRPLDNNGGVPDDAPETTLVDASEWLRHFRQLSERLEAAPTTIPPPAGDRGVEVVSIGVRDPAYWARETDALAEALSIAAQEDFTVRRRVPFIPESERLTFTVEEAATLLGISRAFAYEAVRRGEIPSIRIGRRVLVPKAALQRLVGGDNQTPKTGESDPDT